MVMESRNALFLRAGVVEQARKMTPAQRVRAFIKHSRQMRAIRDAGIQQRKAKRKKASRAG